MSPPGEDKESVRFEFVSQDHGALDQFLALGGQMRLLEIIGPPATLNTARDTIEDFDATQRVLSDGGFATEHDSVGLLENGVGYVCDLRARRHRGFNHTFEHMRRHNHRTA